MGITSSRFFKLYQASQEVNQGRALTEEDALDGWGMNPDLVDVESRVGHKVIFKYRPDGKTYVIVDLGY